jgi:hypothetical protein
MLSNLRRANAMRFFCRQKEEIKETGNSTCSWLLSQHSAPFCLYLPVECSRRPRAQKVQSLNTSWPTVGFISSFGFWKFSHCPLSRYLTGISESPCSSHFAHNSANTNLAPRITGFLSIKHHRHNLLVSIHHRHNLLVSILHRHNLLISTAFPVFLSLRRSRSRYATSWNVVGSSPDKVIERFFNLPNPISRSMVLGVIPPLKSNEY